VLIDEFGERYTARALEMVQADVAQGKPVKNPFGLMISKLRSGEVQAVTEIEDAEDREKDAMAAGLRERYERAQERGDSAAHRLHAKELGPELQALLDEKMREWSE
jgi:hypothetical protein